MQCNFCRNGIGKEFNNELYQINYNCYCSLDCYTKDITEDAIVSVEYNYGNKLHAALHKELEPRLVKVKRKTKKKRK